jgi:hypothetical protein
VPSGGPQRTVQLPRRHHARGKGILGTTLHYPYEIRRDEAVFEEIPEMKLPDQMIGLAEDIMPDPNLGEIPCGRYVCFCGREEEHRSR